MSPESVRSLRDAMLRACFAKTTLARLTAFGAAPRLLGFHLRHRGAFGGSSKRFFPSKTSKVAVHRVVARVVVALAYSVEAEVCAE
jgi:hypothetical protein